MSLTVLPAEAVDAVERHKLSPLGRHRLLGVGFVVVVAAAISIVFFADHYQPLQLQSGGGGGLVVSPNRIEESSDYGTLRNNGPITVSIVGLPQGRILVMPHAPRLSPTELCTTLYRGQVICTNYGPTGAFSGYLFHTFPVDSHSGYGLTWHFNLNCHSPLIGVGTSNPLPVVVPITYHYLWFFTRTVLLNTNLVVLSCQAG